MSKRTKIKLTFCVIWTLFAAGAVWRDVAAESNEKPAAELIEKFDSAVQQRFLTEPGFGITRIMPPNPHLSYFSPKDADEKQSVEAFETGKWRAGLYLFGRRILKEIDEKDGKAKFYVFNPRVAPMPVTKNVKAGDLTASSKLLDETARAFEAFQSADGYEFDDGKWSYTAKPVRARQSCLQCHTDYVSVSKIGEKPFKYRKRRAGDAIGVLLYAFAKEKK